MLEKDGTARPVPREQCYGLPRFLAPVEICFRAVVEKSSIFRPDQPHLTAKDLISLREHSQQNSREVL